jgi:hypothetical protein
MADAARHFLGIDLGTKVDYSALVALEQTPADGGGLKCYGKVFRRYEVRGVKRWPLGTSYHEVCQDVAALVAKPPLAGCVLVPDWTGVGQGVVEILRNARPSATIRPVYITTGAAVAADGPGFKVPKVELVAAVTRLLESNRLAIPLALPGAKDLAAELRQFRARVNNRGHETFEADWRSRAHDDLVLALAIAAWVGEYRQPFFLRAGGTLMGLEGGPNGAPPASEVTAEDSGAMGRVYTVPGNPHRGKGRVVDLREGAPGWAEWRRRMGW